MFRRRLFGVLIGACGLVGCEASSGAGEFVDGFKAGFNHAREQQQATPDRSLTVAEYRALGVPATDHRWSVDELGTAVGALVRLAEEHPEQLPRFESPRSGAVFSRLIEFDAAVHWKEPSGDSTDALAAALAPFAPYTKHYMELSNAYAQAFGGKHVDCREFVEVQGVVMSIAATTEPLMVQTLESLPEGDPRVAMMKRGRLQMHEGYFSILNGSLTMLREDHPDAAKHRLVEVLRAWAPPLFQALSAPDQAKLRLQLRSVPEEFRPPELEAAFE